VTTLPIWVYIGAFVGSGLLATVLTPIALRAAMRRGVLDVPGDHKSHTSPVPYLGGLAIVVAFAGAIGVAAPVAELALLPMPGGPGELAVILALAVALAAAGLLDDLRGLPALLRAAIAIGAVGVLWTVDIRVVLVGVPAADFAITALWVVGITNAFNLLDNMDGLSAGVAAIASAFVFVIAAMNGQFLVATLAVALAGCCLGFLRHNFHPARIYMGDAGSLFLGFLLAVLGLKLRFDAPVEVSFLVPIVVLGVAIFDTVLVVGSRLREGRSPFLGGRDHTSHRLVRMGVPVPVAVVLIYGAGFALGWTGFILVRIDPVSAYLLVGLVGVLGLLGLLALGTVPVYDGDEREPKVTVTPRTAAYDAPEQREDGGGTNGRPAGARSGRGGAPEPARTRSVASGGHRGP
jgi:UDP-GlcNAc:undecaprenyl-phosphate/decaprenyl-phosphate GlcNAc-1-phosphate transferase